MKYLSIIGNIETDNDYQYIIKRIIDFADTYTGPNKALIGTFAPGNSVDRHVQSYCFDNKKIIIKFFARQKNLSHVQV